MGLIPVNRKIKDHNVLVEAYNYLENEKEKLNSKISLLEANINASTVNSQRLEGEITEDNEKINLLKEEMENAVSLAVPLTVDVNIGNTWFDTK